MKRVCKSCLKVRNVTCFKVCVWYFELTNFKLTSFTVYCMYFNTHVIFNITTNADLVHTIAYLSLSITSIQFLKLVKIISKII